ncbi:hypothetical protein M3Y97_00986500 [Aphelenchoides bicaudatus]|nr:hypothetical protein M3Y97_00986500 [Aphelenchoides bicaudatus]
MRLEDVLFTGVIGQMANLTRFNTPAFSYDIITHECSDEKVPLQMGIFGLGYSFIEWKYNELNSVINCSGH